MSVQNSSWWHRETCGQKEKCPAAGTITGNVSGRHEANQPQADGVSTPETGDV